MSDLGDLQRALSWDQRNLALLTHRVRRLSELAITETTSFTEDTTLRTEFQRILTAYLEPAVRALEALARIGRCSGK